MSEFNQEVLELNGIRANDGKVRTVLKKEELNQNIENIDTASGKIVVENGISFVKRLRAEAKRQKEIKRAVMTHAATPIDELPIETTDPELDRLADSMEIIEEDDD